MNRWLMTRSENAEAVPFYIAWAGRLGVECRVLENDEAPPADIGPYAGLLLTGGGDVDPARYGATERHALTYGVNPARDAQELALIDAFRRAGRPIFGICRGLQILTVAFGGRLIQHVPDRLDETVERHRVPKGYDCPHALSWESATRMGRALGDVTSSNSAHHQAMDPAYTAGGLRIAARSGRGVVEAVECFDGAAPILAVQWHPERQDATDPGVQKLVAFIRSVLYMP